MIIRILMLSFLFFTKSALAGGSFVGNGAGLVENNFQYAYISLGHVFSDCLETFHCELNSSELKLLRKMKAVFGQNINKADRLTFVSGNKLPGFFKTGENEDHRIAKTGLTAETVIYVNTDSLYLANGTPALDFSTIISILTHEIGHQAGESNHALLDIIGSKIKKVVSQRLAQHKTEFGEPQQAIEILILNNDFPIKSSKLFLSWENVGSAQLTTPLMSYLKCSEMAATMSGFEMVNGHYFLTTKKEIVAEPSVGFGLWVSLYCYSAVDNMTRVEKYAIDFEFQQDLKINFVEVKRIN